MFLILRSVVINTGNLPLSRIFYEIEFNSIVNFIFCVVLRALNAEGKGGCEWLIHQQFLLPMFVCGLIVFCYLTHEAF